MIIECAAGGPAETNGYLVADPVAGEAVIVDAPAEATEILLAAAARRNLKVVRLLLSHGHWDHIAEHARVTTETGAPVGIPPDDEFMLRDGQPPGLWCPFPIPRRSADFHLTPGTDLRVGGLRFEVLHTPGHSPGSCCLRVRDLSAEGPDAELLLAGDTLFAGSVGRMDFPGGDPEAMTRSLRRLMELPDALPVLPGHGPATTIGAERSANPYVRQALRGSLHG
jgi:glyoxylase-like metal-dependent hydrolase (beta-lactamase superfamily II)